MSASASRRFELGDERLSKILRDAILAPDDTHAIVCLNGARRHLEGINKTGHDIEAWSRGDDTSLSYTSSLRDRLMEQLNEAERAADRYRKRVAILEKAMTTIRSVSRATGGHDRKDYRLGYAIESARLPDIVEILETCKSTLSKAQYPESEHWEPYHRDAVLRAIDSWLGNAEMLKPSTMTTPDGVEI